MNKNINLKLIIAGCRRENRQSQRILFEHFFGYGMNICLRYTKNKEEAEEVLNNGFLKIFKHIQRYDSNYPFRTWLRQIMVNTAIDHYRANQKAPTFLELNTDILENNEPSYNPPFLEKEDMLPIIQQLPPAYRMVFNLYVMEEYNHNEIGELLGISPKTSRSNLSRAKEKLRQMIENNQGKIIIKR